MTEIISNKAEVNADIGEVFSFLTDMNNYELLLPKDNISHWRATDDEFSCKIQNTYTISLHKNGATEYSEIRLKSSENSPLKFNLDLKLNEIGDNRTTAQLFCNADLNPFLKMMALKPLQNLFNYMAKRLEKVFPES